MHAFKVEGFVLVFFFFLLLAATFCAVVLSCQELTGLYALICSCSASCILGFLGSCSVFINLHSIVSPIFDNPTFALGPYFSVIFLTFVSRCFPDPPPCGRHAGTAVRSRFSFFVSNKSSNACETKNNDNSKTGDHNTNICNINSNTNINTPTIPATKFAHLFHTCQSNQTTVVIHQSNLASLWIPGYGEPASNSRFNATATPACKCTFIQTNVEPRQSRLFVCHQFESFLFFSLTIEVAFFIYPVFPLQPLQLHSSLTLFHSLPLSSTGRSFGSVPGSIEVIESRRAVLHHAPVSTNSPPSPSQPQQPRKISKFHNNNNNQLTSRCSSGIH
jgi:hypothetical protein